MELKTKKILTLEIAKEISRVSEEKAVALGLSVSIAVMNDGGFLLHFVRMDSTPNNSGDIAVCKARHSVNYRRPTKFHEDLLDKGNQVVLALPGSMPLEGGLPIVVDGEVIGSIGVSGAPSDRDGVIAAAGLEALATIGKS